VATDARNLFFHDPCLKFLYILPSHRSRGIISIYGLTDAQIKIAFLVVLWGFQHTEWGTLSIKWQFMLDTWPWSVWIHTPSHTQTTFNCKERIMLFPHLFTSKDTTSCRGGPISLCWIIYSRILGKIFRLTTEIWSIVKSLPSGQSQLIVFKNLSGTKTDFSFTQEQIGKKSLFYCLHIGTFLQQNIFQWGRVLQLHMVWKQIPKYHRIPVWNEAINYTLLRPLW